MRNDRTRADQTEWPPRSESSKVIRELTRIGAQVGLLLRPSPNPLFDKEFYKKRHQHDVDAIDNPLKHYLAHGQQFGFDPNPYFDNGWYACQHDLGKQSALEHFLQKGEADGAPPHPLWDEKRYVAINRDVELAKQAGILKSGYRHFVTTGVWDLEAGHDRHFQFAWGDHVLDYDRLAYLADNPDVRIAVAQNRFRNGLEHLFGVGFREALDGLRAIYGRDHAVRLLKDLPGEAPAGGKHLCLFAHYDRDDIVDAYVFDYLAALRAANVDIIFITETLVESELRKVAPLVRRILVRNPAGRDFGSWWLALRTLGMDIGEGYNRVIWANDSIYFPVRPIAPLFSDMERKDYNLYGLSDSREILGRYHIQSFFLAFDREAQQKIFSEFLSKFEQYYVLTKWGQVREYELGITEMTRAAGLSVGAHISLEDIRDEVTRQPALQRWGSMFQGGVDHLNPAHDLWDLVIGRYGYCGLKVELLRDNPKGAVGFESLPGLIADGAVPIQHIYAHQKRMKARRSPRVITPRVDPTPVIALRQRIDGSGPSTARRLILFAHYDPDSIVDDHIVYQISALVKVGCSVAVITSADHDDELKKLMPFTSHILVRDNIGRDFGAWYLALQELRDVIGSYDYVIWMNDSIYFPLFDLEPMFSKMEQEKYDFWGIVDSYNARWHVMSWFWAFGRRSIEAGWFDWFMKEYNPAHTKWAQIHNYEMRLPELIKKSGLKTGVYIEAQEVRSQILQRFHQHPRINPAQRGDFTMTHDFWEEIISEFRCPALKVELLRDNPLGIDLSAVLRVVRDKTQYDPELIRRHLLRLKTRHLPPPTRAQLGYPSESDRKSRTS
jgi:lipopolysaccharide biosynthesis protein